MRERLEMYGPNSFPHATLRNFLTRGGGGVATDAETNALSVRIPVQPLPCYLDRAISVHNETA